MRACAITLFADVQVMYQKIMTAKLVIPETISSDAASLLRGLLERDPNKRLQDPDTIKAHPYFKSIDWKAMSRKEVKAPYVPNQSGSIESTDCIDPEFTAQEVKLTYEVSKTSLLCLVELCDSPHKSRRTRATSPRAIRRTSRASRSSRAVATCERTRQKYTHGRDRSFPPSVRGLVLLPASSQRTVGGHGCCGAGRSGHGG